MYIRFNSNLELQFWEINYAASANNM